MFHVIMTIIIIIYICQLFSYNNDCLSLSQYINLSCHIMKPSPHNIIPTNRVWSSWSGGEDIWGWCWPDVADVAGTSQCSALQVSAGSPAEPAECLLCPPSPTHHLKFLNQSDWIRSMRHWRKVFSEYNHNTHRCSYIQRATLSFNL